MNFDILVNSFVEIYTLPLFSEISSETKEKNTKEDEKFQDIKIKLESLYETLNINLRVDEITQDRYDFHVDNLKSILIDNLISANNQPAFLIINEIYTKLKSKHVDLCEKLMLDMSSKINENNMKKEVRLYLHHFFKKYDTSGDGNISKEELENQLSELGLPKEMAKEIMMKADTDCDGGLSMTEFENYFEERVLKQYKLFYNLDSDGDKRLNYNQVRQALHELYPSLKIDSDTYKRLYKTIDQDQSGLINFREWCEFLIMFPEKNLEEMVNKLNLISLTTMDPQEINSVAFEEDLMEFKEKNYTFADVVNTLICGSISGALSATITAPLERLKVVHQTKYKYTKPPSILFGLMEIVKQKGFHELFRGNSISIAMSLIENGLRFLIIDFCKNHFEDEQGTIDPHKYILIGFITTMVSSAIVFPLQVVKVRIIVSDLQEHKVYNKIKTILNNNGVKGFYAGMVPHMLTVLPAGTMNVFFYNLLKKYFVLEEDKMNPKVTKFMMIGGSAGLITGTITYPLNLITSRLINASRNINVPKISFMKMVIQTYKSEGLGGFFKGYAASIVRMILGSGITNSSYEHLKSFARSRKNEP